ncbi:MAG TPA: hemolysin III family protein [Acidimicrobiia bacterium]|nr:hemolysin III family protein [Acidimicrobiia bacterium]
MDSLDRVRLGKMTNPVRGFLHGTAAVASVVGAALLTLLAQGGIGNRISLLVFGVALVSLYTVSCLYHSIPWGPVWKSRMRRLDHTMIYVLVAGTFTPIAWIALDGWLRVATLSTQWAIVAAGAAQKAFFPQVSRSLSVVLQTTQGWLAVPLLWPLARALPWTALLMIALGGVSYTVGMVLLVTNRPRLWPAVFSYHEVFHVLVVAGSSLHFAMVARYLLRFAG